jgi:hypothetical protein
MTTSQPQRPQFHTNFCGTLHWSCPDCGHVNKHRLAYLTWQIQCKFARCRHKFGIGFRLLRLRKGGHNIYPSDHIMPSFARSEIGTYNGRRDRRTNRVDPLPRSPSCGSSL